jgi:hypothetical protein
VFEGTGDTRHFAYDFPDGSQLPNLVIDGRVGCAWGAGARAARYLYCVEDNIIQTNKLFGLPMTYSNVHITIDETGENRRKQKKNKKNYSDYVRSLCCCWLVWH